MATFRLLSGFTCSLPAPKQELMLLNGLRFYPGLVFVAVLVALVCSIPLLCGAKHMRQVQPWPAGADRRHSSLIG